MLKCKCCLTLYGIYCTINYYIVYLNGYICDDIRSKFFTVLICKVNRKAKLFVLFFIVKLFAACYYCLFNSKCSGLRAGRNDSDLVCRLVSSVKLNFGLIDDTLMITDVCSNAAVFVCAHLIVSCLYPFKSRRCELAV